MTRVTMDLTDAFLLQDNIQESLNAYTFQETQRVPLELDDEVAEWLCDGLFAAMPEESQHAILTQLPEPRRETLLASLATQHGYGLIHPASSTDLSPVADTPGRTNGASPMPPAALFLPCLAPVGPSRCFHPGSHHAAHGGHCTHPGCDCAAFRPEAEAPPRVSVSTETVMDYLRRITLLHSRTWDGDDTFAALHRAWVPAAAPVSDWHRMLGRVFPDMAEIFTMEVPR